MRRSSKAEAAENQRTGPYPLIWRMKYVWIEESPNTASDCGVAPPKKGDGLRSRCGTTRKVEEHCPRPVQGLGWRKSSRSFAGKTVWRADRDKNPQKRYVQGSDGRTRDVGRLVSVKRSWRRRHVAGKGLTRPHAPAREMQSPAGKWRVAGAWIFFWCRCLHKSWRSPPGAPFGMVGVGKRLRTGSSPEKFTGKFAGKFWEMGKVTGMKHGHRKVYRS